MRSCDRTLGRVDFQAVLEARMPTPFGKYMLLKQIAVGGMAEVYLARQNGPEGFEKECVIKRILPALAADQQFVEMFLDEARIAARLSHPNIVQLFDLGKMGEKDYFLAMEHVPGVDLQRVLENEGRHKRRVPLAIALRILSNVAEGLDHAHRATDGRGAALGIVHRDVTPSNVIVSFDGIAKVLDFGIAKAVAKTWRTEVGVVKGKIPYMSPEQVRGEQLDARSDLFSLGGVLYEITTGKKPFEGGNPAEIAMNILHHEPAAPSTLVPNFPPHLEAILQRCLAKDRDQRYASGRELQVAIDELLVANGIRCTSHEVASYIEQIFPGLRQSRTEETAAIDTTDSTVLPPNSGIDEPSLKVGEMRMPTTLTGNDNVEEARRNLAGSSKAMILIIAMVVIAVAVGFSVMSHRASSTTPSSSTPTTPPPPSLTASGSQAAVVEPTKIEPKAEPKSAPKAEPKPDSKPEAKGLAKPEIRVESAAKRPAHIVPRPKAESKLPRLPTPPPSESD